jgi:hypothetical protein
MRPRPLLAGTPRLSRRKRKASQWLPLTLTVNLSEAKQAVAVYEGEMSITAGSIAKADDAYADV